MEPAKKILCFGELLLRLCPDAGGEWLRQNSMGAYVGGAEANVATALARWGNPVDYLTAVPDHFLATQMLSLLEAKSIGTGSCLKTTGRIGTYYLPQGSDVKHTGIIYDRAGSAFSHLKTGMIDWDAALRDVKWFHFSAICPAIGQNVADVCMEALEAASAKDIPVSLDLNYRAKLWQFGKKPVEIMPALAQQCSLIMGNVWAAETMLGIAVDPDLQSGPTKEKYVKQAHETALAITERFPKCTAVANTFRFGDDTDIEYYTTLFSAGETRVSSEYRATSIIDKVGSGDCFMAGLIHGLLHNETPQETLEFATAAAFSMLFTPSDSTDKSVSEITQLRQKHAIT